MKKLLLLTMLFGVSSVCMYAQDDLYFSYKKKAKNVESTVEKLTPDEADDTFDFEIGDGLYPDSLSVSDFVDDDTLSISDNFEEDEFYYTRRMGRFEDFYGYYDPFYYDYYHNPYIYPGYYSWYDPWVYRWYDPWYYTYGYGRYGYYHWYMWPYYGGYYSWNWPYYYGYYGHWDYYRYPYYGLTNYYTYRGHTGTGNHWGHGRNHNNGDLHSNTRGSAGNFIGYRGPSTNGVNTSASKDRRATTSTGNIRGGKMTKSRNTGTSSLNRQSRSTDSNSNYNNRRSNRDFDAINNGPRSMGSHNSYSSGMGSSRAGGFSGGHTGGTRSGGGGHFGGRR